jgi:protein O-mannosyl-transferase
MAFCPAVLWVVALVLAVTLYRPGLAGPFVFDDTVNIVANQSLRLSDLSWPSLYGAATSIPNGMFGRPLSMLSFAADFYRSGDALSPSPLAYTFKATNLLIHLANGCVLWVLTRLLARASSDLRSTPLLPSYAAWLALAVAGAWMLHPFNLTGVLYVVQRMTSLATLFTGLGMVCYLIGRRRLADAQAGAKAQMLAALLVFTPLAFLCKEIGILLPVYVVLMEVFLFSRGVPGSSQRRFLTLYFAVLVWLPLALGLFLFATHTDWFLNAYSRRDFSLVERLMTESRVVWLYAQQTVLPDIASMGLFHDDFPISTSLLQPVSTAIALVGLIALVVVCVALRKVQPLLGFGIAFFLVGHSMESTVIPLELVHEHRNYLPSLGVLLVLFHGLLDPTTAPGTRLWRRAGAVLLVLLWVVVTQSRVAEWSSPQTLWEAETRHHPASIRANVSKGDFYAGRLSLNPLINESSYANALSAYEQALVLDPNNVSALFGILKLDQTFQKPASADAIEALRLGLHHGAVLANANDRLIDLALCIGHANCPVNAVQYESLLGAALDNAKLQGRDKALIYSAQTFYLTHVARDYPRALLSARKAIALSGDIEHQMWIATILTATHDVQAAQLQIDLLRLLDVHQAHEKEISILELQNTLEYR